MFYSLILSREEILMKSNENAENDYAMLYFVNVWNGLLVLKDFQEINSETFS